MRQDERHAIARAVYQHNRDEISDQLGREIQQDQAPQALVGDGVPGLKDNEQQGCEIIHNGLGDIPSIARPAGVVEGHRDLWE
jgi:hypothetical protein